MTATAWNQKTIDEFHAKLGLGVGQWGDHVLLMTSRGAKTGREITTPLVYRRVGDEYIVIASKGGAPNNPNWFHNIHVNPDVQVEVASTGGTEHFTARARAVPDGAEHDRLYEFMIEVWPSFRDYQERTTRRIPVVILDRQP